MLFKQQYERKIYNLFIAKDRMYIPLTGPQIQLKMQVGVNIGSKSDYHGAFYSEIVSYFRGKWG